MSGCRGIEPCGKVLVTGAKGFIGQQLCLKLGAAGVDVRALLRRESVGPWSSGYVCELGKERIPRDCLDGVDTIFHLGGVSHVVGESEKVFRRVNVDGSRELLESAVTLGIERFIFFSSVKAVKDPPDSRCIDEAWMDAPQDAYGRSKREAEDIVLETAARAGMQAVILRPTLVYGPGVKGNLRKIIQLVAAGRCPPLPDTGNQRSMVHVEDLCELAIKVVGHPGAAGKRYIVADKRPYSTYELYAGILQALGRPVPNWSVPSRFLRAAGQVGDFGERFFRRRIPVNSGLISRLLDSACYSSALCQEEIGWQPRHDLPGSIPEMVAAWQKEQEEPDHRSGTTRS